MIRYTYEIYGDDTETLQQIRRELKEMAHHHQRDMHKVQVILGVETIDEDESDNMLVGP